MSSITSSGAPQSAVQQTVTLTPAMDVKQVLTLFSQGKITLEQYNAWDAQRIAAIEQAAKRSNGNGGGLRCKVSPKGALSIYGLQRMPVTLYVEQWERLLEFAPHLREFMAKQNGSLSRKNRS